MIRRAAPLLLVFALLAGCGSSSSKPAASTTTTTSTQPTSATGPEGVLLESGPELAPAATTVAGTTVSGIPCGATEQLVYHIHSHLAVFVNGQQQTIPAGVGIVQGQTEQTPEGPFVGGGQCFYLLHTHSTDGIIHVESPKRLIYTLGNFFAIWDQPLNRGQVASATGTVTAYVNGHPWKGDPRLIRLFPHTAIQLDVGEPATPFQPVPSWGNL
jgi:hypothetical protein